MFHSLSFLDYIGFDKKTRLYDYQYELMDTDFGNAVLCGTHHIGSISILAAEGIIREYAKRELNVAANLILFFRWYEMHYSISIAVQIERLKKYLPIFTPELKTDVDKYLALV